MTLSKLRTFIYYSLIAMHLMTIAHAQERAAGGTTETQMTWSALKNLVDTARSESKGAHDRLDQMLVCNKQQMIYAPGVSGADTAGCISNSDLNNIITCGDTGTIYDKSAKKCVNPMAEVIACGKTGQVYNGTGCVDTKSAEGKGCSVTWNKTFPECAKQSCAIKETYNHSNSGKVLSGTNYTFQNNELIVFKYEGTSNEGVTAQCLNGNLLIHGISLK